MENGPWRFAATGRNSKPTIRPTARPDRIHFGEAAGGGSKGGRTERPPLHTRTRSARRSGRAAARSARKSPANRVGLPKSADVWLATYVFGLLALVRLKPSAMISKPVLPAKLNFFETRRSSCVKVAPRAELSSSPASRSRFLPVAVVVDAGDDVVGLGRLVAEHRREVRPAPGFQTRADREAMPEVVVVGFSGVAERVEGVDRIVFANSSVARRLVTDAIRTTSTSRGTAACRPSASSARGDALVACWGPP